MVERLWRDAAAAMQTKLHKHDEVHTPADYNGKYRVLTDNEAVDSVAPGNLLNDTACNAFVAAFNLRMRQANKKVRMLYTHFYLVPGPGSIRTGYTIPVICDLFAADIEAEFPGGLLALDTILVPINIPGHWKLGVVDLKNKRIEMSVTPPRSAMPRSAECPPMPR